MGNRWNDISWGTLATWIKLNTPVTLYPQFNTHNYYAPLTNRVNKLETLHSITMLKAAPQQCSLLAASTMTSHVQHQVKFVLPRNLVDKNSTAWRRNTMKRPTSSPQIGVLTGGIPSAVSNTGGLASAFKPMDPTNCNRHTV